LHCSLSANAQTTNKSAINCKAPIAPATNSRKKNNNNLTKGCIFNKYQFKPEFPAVNINSKIPLL